MDVSTPLSSIIRKPEKYSNYKGFGEFKKVKIGRFRPKKSSLDCIKCGKSVVKN